MDETVYDLCIVGAGMFGSAAARHASANAGVKVCLVGPEEPSAEEKMSREIFGAHYDEGRISRILDNDIPTITLSKLSISRYRQLEELSGIQFYHPVGCLHVSKRNSPCARNILQIGNLANLPFVDLSYNDILKRSSADQSLTGNTKLPQVDLANFMNISFPFLKLKSDDQPLLDDTGSGHVSPRNMVAAQKKVAQLQGCRIVKDVVNEVTSLNDNIHEVKTEKGSVLKSKRILICAGAFINLKNFPIPKLKIFIDKESAAFLKIPAEEADRLSSMPCMLYFRPEIKTEVYILPPIKYPDGHYYLKIGHMDNNSKAGEAKTLEDIKDWYLSNGDADLIKSMSKVLISILPNLKYKEITGLSCVTCMSPSEQPYIDRVSPTVTVAAVGNARGVKISDEVGRIAAHLSLTGKWDSELSQNHFKIIVDEE